MKLELFAAGQGVYQIQIDGKPTGYNAVNMGLRGVWRIRKDCRDPHNDSRLMLLVDREVTHLIHRPEAFAAFVLDNQDRLIATAQFTADDIGNFETYTRAGDGESDGVYTITYVSPEGDTTQQEGK